MCKAQATTTGLQTVAYFLISDPNYYFLMCFILLKMET